LLSPVPKKGKFINAVPITYVLKFNDKTYKVKIPAKFLYDGASVPRLLWSTTGHPYTPEFQRAGLLHDMGYRHNPLNLPKQIWDLWFYYILTQDYVGGYTAKKMYWGVKIFGWYAWGQHRKREKREKAKQ